MKKFLHLADLHIGKKLGDYSLLEDQKFVLRQAVEVAKNENCDGILIAGDIYDKANPGTEAMAVFDEFLTELCNLHKPVYLISGNHDAPGRISYLGKFLAGNQIIVPEKFTGTLQAVSDPDDEIQIYLLPFITPARVREFYKNPDEKLNSYQDAVKIILKHSEIPDHKINILVAHQYITNGIKSEEEFSIGGLDNIDSSVFDQFDYVALGHLHRPQKCNRETIRYAGSPLKYSLSEEHQKKSFTILEIQDKQHIRIETIPIRLPHDVRTVRGNFEELSAMPRTLDYVRIILTDENPIPDARAILRDRFPRMLQFRIENSKFTTDQIVTSSERIEQKYPVDMFRMFYQMQNNSHDPSERQLEIVRSIFDELQEEKNLIS
ncbi:MAG: exonuclease SbcCD subunit D [Oscillospiraceae bacterium]|nr:exonuclease SbcCD subunit D [Oscillospiraceae bacterium]